LHMDLPAIAALKKIVRDFVDGLGQPSTTNAG